MTCDLGAGVSGRNGPVFVIHGGKGLWVGSRPCEASIVYNESVCVPKRNSVSCVVRAGIWEQAVGPALWSSVRAGVITAGWWHADYGHMCRLVGPGIEGARAACLLAKEGFLCMHVPH